LSALKRFVLRLLEQRRKVAPAVLLIGAVVVGTQLFDEVPRDVELNYALGPDHDEIVGLTLSYEQSGEEVSVADFSWPNGAPPRLHHEVELAPGTYRVRAELRDREHRMRSVEKRFDVPADGIVNLDLFTRALASRRSGSSSNGG
jgi:hypothetical protein